MKKAGVFIVLILLLSIMVLAANNTTVNETNPPTPKINTSSDQGKIENGFKCLEQKANKCSGLNTQEIALTILASPNNIYDDCVKELEAKKSSNNWGNVRDTALAILALQHSGKSTEAEEEWLLSKSLIPTDLIWYLQQDSDGQTECSIFYDSNSYTINIGENKKIDNNAGPCLTKAQSDFWLKVSSNCYNNEFITTCDKDFITSLLYKNQNSPTIYVLEGTDSAPSFGDTTTKINSKCFGDSSCDYEATVWAAVALLETHHDIEEYIPYVVAMADSNARYLPEAFIYIITGSEEYASKLIANQKLGNFWEADNTLYNKDYDTAIALLSIGDSTQDQIVKARGRLLFSQSSSGCWQNSLRDTAMVLWALEGRAPKTSPGGKTTTCSEADFFCIPKSDCPTSSDVSSSFFCSGSGKVCCKTKNLKTCSESDGQVCPAGKDCNGYEGEATDTTKCCKGTCEDPVTIDPDPDPDENECEAADYWCDDSCAKTEEEKDYACDTSDEVCCGRKGSDPPIPSNPWYIWVLVVLILIVLAAILWVYRENLKLWWFKMRSKFKKDKGRGSGSYPPGGPFGPGGMPPRPGFPPVRRQPAPVPQRQVPLRPAPPRPAPQRGQPQTQRRDDQMSDTFRKLKEMSK